MKKYVFQVVMYVTIHLVTHSQPSIKHGSPVVAPSDIVSSMQNWLTYERDYMIWSADYTALDTAMNSIAKGDFLSMLTTGKYCPVKLFSNDSSPYYQLYKIEDSTNTEIRNVIKNLASVQYAYYKMEGKPLSKASFTDIDNNVYDSSNIRGKILVVNCWFIHCRSCVAEIPQLNEVVNQFKDRNDILFLGLAFDSVSNLKRFLKKKKFKYTIIPNQTDYLMNDLKIYGYPTHIIVNKQGVIKKIITNFNEMLDALRQEAQQ